MTYSTIILKLARNPDAGFAQGDDERGYVLHAPLTPDGRLDAHAYGATLEPWTVRRIVEGRAAAIGRLARRGAHWLIDYDPQSTRDDEPAFRLGDHCFVAGEYVTVTTEDDVPLTYRVVQVEPAKAGAGSAQPVGGQSLQSRD